MLRKGTTFAQHTLHTLYKYHTLNIIYVPSLANPFIFSSVIIIISYSIGICTDSKTRKIICLIIYNIYKAQILNFVVISRTTAC